MRTVTYKIVQAKSLHQEVVPCHCQCLYNSESTSGGLETRLPGRGQRILNNGFDTDFLGDSIIIVNSACMSLAAQQRGRLSVV